MPRSLSKDIRAKTFLQLGSKYTREKGGSTSPYVKLRRFKNLFEVTPEVCLVIWNKICDKLPDDFKPIHLLWTLAFLKHYTNERERQTTFKADQKTMRKWIWVALDLLSDLDVIVWENRKQKSVGGQTAFCSLDSIDLKIRDQNPSSPKWYSHKLKAPGLRYEIGISIQTGHIVWKNTGYPCGDSSETALARESYTLCVEPGEKTFAKKSYRNEQFFILPNPNNKTEHERIMARHLELTQRLKRFASLKQPFRHDLEKHTTVFNAVINVIQLMLENGDPLRDVDYSTQLEKPENGHPSAEEVLIKTEPADDIQSTDPLDTNYDASICSIKIEPVNQVHSECIKSEITLCDYECIPSTGLCSLTQQNNINQTFG
ncbi:uncharacterized protein LOC119081971 [Bradysia coprophila]|uniref:uncharacterized protein LOC119081971 n=1 Tax=Bradysia coprophila TaxID=38358 RepID=UPI00187DBEE2|nr:uncharacterized protein LOC119081971 [Bradysia coprophila]